MNNENLCFITSLNVHVLRCFNTQFLSDTAAEGTHFCQINTGSYYYADVNMKYLGINMLDLPQTKISIYFQETADFIDRAIQGGGRVLIHCMVGLSRSATLVIAYLMIKRDLTLEEALRTVRRHRQVRPNDGFLRQLIDLEYKIKSGNSTLYASAFR